MMIMLCFCLFTFMILSPFVYFKIYWNYNSLFYSLTMFFSFLCFPFSYSYYQFNLYVDYISFFLIFLSFFICMLMYISSNKIYKFNSNAKYFLLCLNLLLITLVISFGVSSALSFYFFFEFSLIPTMVLIMGWGSQVERIQSTVYFLMYTLFASLPLLLFILKLQNYHSGFYFSEGMCINKLSNKEYYITFYIFWMSLGAFLVKMPMYMFHLWLPKAHVEAPVSGSMILAGVLLKLGGYGMIRISYLMKYVIMKFSYLFMSLSIFSIILISLNCIRSNDLKSLVAYSSVAHMALSLTGLLSMYSFGLLGNFLMLVGHGICSSGLFMLINLIYERSGSRSMLINKGLMVYSLMLCASTFILTVINLGAPPSMNLFSELFLVSSCVSYSLVIIPVVILGSLMVALYCMVLFSSSNHGKFYSPFFLFLPINVLEYFSIYYHCLILFISFMFMNLVS